MILMLMIREDTQCAILVPVQSIRVVNDFSVSSALRFQSRICGTAAVFVAEKRF